MSDGWGQDFDEDGNVIGEVPDSGVEPFHREHQYKILAVAGVLFAITAPGFSTMQARPGVAVGAGLASLAIAALVVAGYERVRG